MKSEAHGVGEERVWEMDFLARNEEHKSTDHCTQYSHAKIHPPERFPFNHRNCIWAKWTIFEDTSLPRQKLTVPLFKSLIFSSSPSSHHFYDKCLSLLPISVKCTGRLKGRAAQLTRRLVVTSGPYNQTWEGKPYYGHTQILGLLIYLLEAVVIRFYFK